MNNIRNRGNRFAACLLKACLLLAALPALQGCHLEDDIGVIFTGKAWKLSYIFHESNYKVPIDLWAGDSEAQAASVDLRNVAGNFVIEFTGAEMNGQFGGAFKGRVARSTFSGRWMADGDTRSLSFSEVRWEGSETDPLAKAFQNGIMNAFKYSGDSSYLYIHYYEGGLVRVIGLVPAVSQ